MECHLLKHEKSPELPQGFFINGVLLDLNFFRRRALERRFSGLDYLAGLDHAGRDPHVLNGTARINDLDALQVGLDHAQSLAYDLGTCAALATDHAASFIFAT